MNILFIGYWSVFDSLSIATIRPHLEVLSSFEKVTNIYYVSIERDCEHITFQWDIPKVVHIPYYSGHNLLQKIQELLMLSNFLVKICQEKEITTILARTSPAGIYAYLTHRKIGIPYYVESFEPHADYMRANGVWRIWDPRYLLQKYFEKKIKHTVSGLMPVSNAFKNILLQDPKITCPIETLPCTVNLDKFKIDKPLGDSTREKIGFAKDDLVGIYVGKFGDIYFDEEAFAWFGAMKNQFTNFRLILLTGEDKVNIAHKLVKVGFVQRDFFIDQVPHEEVTAYLNAADLAFSLIKPHKFSFACSPIKNGEYWACGLPIVIPSGIGDDSEFLKESGLGVVVEDIKDPKKHFDYLEMVINTHEKDIIRQLAQKNRNPKLIIKRYRKIFFTES